MEKVRYIVISLLLMLGSQLSAQVWITGISADYQMNRSTWDSTRTYNTVLDFPSLTYDQTFESRVTAISNLNAHLGMHNRFIFNKNILIADFQLGLSKYDYAISISKKANSFPLDTAINEFGINDSISWSNYANSVSSTSVSALYPSIRIHVGYERQLLLFRNLSINGDAGLYVDRKFSFFQNFNRQINETSDTISAFLGPLLIHRKFIPSIYAGFSIKYTSHQFGIRIGTSIGPVTRKVSPFVLKESFAQITYTKLIKETHLGKEQVIYDEYQHLAQTRASEYRRGDKFSYIQFNVPHKKCGEYEDDMTSSWVIENNDSILVNTKGHMVQPNMGIGLMLNTFFTHRWMMGLGLSLYGETYASYGTLDQQGSAENFGEEMPQAVPDNSYQTYWNKNKAAVALNTAVYVFNRTLPVDPYVKATANMVMDYDVPEFLKDEPEWRTTAFFPIYQIGAGFDIRLRIKSSKFFVVGLGADYNINPHVNYMQYYARVGYYRKKKIKNQRY